MKRIVFLLIYVTISLGSSFAQGDGGITFTIRNIQSSSPWVAPSKTTFVINKGEIEEIKVNVDNRKITSAFVSTLSIISDDPRNPLFEVKITANP